MRRAGDNEAALGIYQKANVPQKVIEGLAAKGDFEALSKFRYSSIAPAVGTYVHHVIVGNAYSCREAIVCSVCDTSPQPCKMCRKRSMYEAMSHPVGRKAFLQLV